MLKETLLGCVHNRKVMALGALFLICPATTFAASAPHADMQGIEKVQHTTQAKLQIKGVVEDKDGPIIGASVIEKGTTNGTVTNMDGEFNLSVGKNATIVVSYIGYKPQEIKVDGKKSFKIKLEEDAKALDEVVVVGYGTQKKVNLSGSVSSIDMNDMAEKRPITNVSQALAGMAAGVHVSSSSNQPGNDNASIQVRGQGTLNNSAPLVIIDGVEGNINSVSPQDIASMSVLKDAASASIYGSRAANGVILITTKKGKAGAVKVDYTGYVSFESIRKTLTPLTDYARYMEIINSGYEASGKGKKFSQKSIDEWREHKGDELNYPNTDWIDQTFKNGVSTNHTLSVSGGSDKIHFYSSFSYLNNPGVMENSGFRKYSARVNVDAKVKEWLSLGVQGNGYVGTFDPSAKYGSANSPIDEVFKYGAATTPSMIFKGPDGRFGGVQNNEDDAQASNNNTIKRLYSLSGDINKYNMRARFYGTITPLKGLSITASYVFDYTDLDTSFRPNSIDMWNFRDNTIVKSNVPKTYISNNDTKSIRHFNDIVAKYNHHFLNDRLNMDIMLGASQEEYMTKSFAAKRFDLISSDITAMNGAYGASNATGKNSEWAMRSFFGRVNLGWSDKYLLEMNLRSDASSRFLSKKRVGYFPSVSAAWRMEQEPFMQQLVNKGLDNLKLRASYGTLGNNAIGNYDALSVYSVANYVLNHHVESGLAQQYIANQNLTWESTAVADFGIDFGMFKNRFTGTIDYFHKRTKDILINLPAPDVHGIASIPKVNSATVTNQGLEMTLGWRDRIKDFNYSISGNFTYITNMVNKYKGKERSISGTNIIQEGYPINTQYMLLVDRIIQTPEDQALVEEMIKNNPDAFIAYYGKGKPELGDFLYKDTNGRDADGNLTGKPDGKINDDDRVVLNYSPNPKYMFGLNLGASWKGWDFSLLLQGQAGIKVFWQSSMINTPSIRHGYQINKELADNAWTSGRTDAKAPRLLYYEDTRNLKNSDFYLANKAYVKIKNIQLGYTLPQSFTKKLQMERLRFYTSMENFFTFTSYKGFDPEISGLAYPAIREMVVGVNVSF